MVAISYNPMKMKSIFRSFPLLAVLSAALGAPSPAADVFWTNGTGNPMWDGTLLQANWSTFFTVPTGSDTVIFPASFTPTGAQDTFVGARTDGSEILLTNVAAPGGLPPTAANLVFLNSWILTQKPGQIPGFHWGFSPLLLTVGDVTVVPHATAVIDANITVTSGLLTKFGEGTLLLEQTVTGSVLAQEGVLGGNFTTTGNLTNLATLSPGNSPGKITVGGNFQQAKSGTLALEVASPQNYDVISVIGRAKLDGKLDVALLNSFHPEKGEKFTIVTADRVSGEFDSVNAPVWDYLTLRPFYTKNAVTLEAVVASFGNLPGLSANQHAVGRNLDTVLTDSRETSLLHYLYGQSLQRLPSDLDRIAPEEFTSMFTIGTAYAQVQSLNLQRRTDDLRNGSSGFSAAGLAINGSGPSYSGGFGLTTGVAGPTGNDGKESKEVKQIVPAESRWGAFLTGTGEWVSVGNTDNARGYTLGSGGFTFGVDYKATPNFAIGLAGGYVGTTADLTDRGRVWVNGGKLGLYATFFQNQSPAPAPTMSKDSSKDSSKEAPAPAASPMPGFYVDMAAFGGYNSYDTRRSGIQGEARGDTDGGEVNALFGAGYDFKMGGLTFGPTATFNYTYVGTNGFTEHGSLAPLDVHGGDADSLRTAFGFKVSYDCKVGGVLIKPELRAAWQHEFGDSVFDLSSNFANGGGGTFTVAGPQVGRDSALLGAGFAIQFNERMSTYFYYDGELGRRNYESNSVTGGLRVAF
jgi:outer membrane autotransporter protein